ncbi:MAG: DUF362 domain-containing protein [Bdellovibrionota bacterium]
MRRLDGPFRVYVGLVQTGYLNPAAISEVIRQGIYFCGLSGAVRKLGSSSKIVLRPDVTAADPRIARYAYTHPEVVRATIQEVLHLSPSAKFNVLAKSIDGLPTHRMLRKAHGASDTFLNRGYLELEHLFPGNVTVSALEETPVFRYQLSKGNILSKKDRTRLQDQLQEDFIKTAHFRSCNEVITSRHFYDSSFSIACPKLKTSVFTQAFSGAVALGGFQKLHGSLHDHYLADMLELFNPNLVVSDCIVAAVGGSQITQRGHELGAVLISNNAVAHDWVAVQILNLDPSKIRHLRIAAERGWGPLSPAQVELGGAGAEGIKQLLPKTKFWDLGDVHLEDFPKKYSEENNGVRFPVEIQSGTPYEQSGSHALVLDWLYKSYDFPALRPNMAKWPKTTLCIGEVQSYPSHRVVFAIGDHAIQSLKLRTSSARKLIRLGKDIRISRVQMKNGKKCWLITVSGNPPKYRNLFLALMVGSFGRMTTHWTKFPLLVERFFFAIRNWWHSASAQRIQNSRVVLSSRMAQNAWWALTSSSTSPSKTSALSSPEPRSNAHQPTP